MKRYLLLALMLSPLSCNADTVTDSLVLQSASNDFNRKFKVFSDKDEECRSSAVVLPSNTFEGFDLSKEQLTTAVTYHYYKSLAECTEDAVNEYAASALLLAALVDQEMAKNVMQGSEIVIDKNLQLAKLEVEYNKLSEEQRRALDDIAALQKPFKLVESAKSVGL